MNLNPMLREHRAWRELCEALEETGAVTRADAESPVHILETPGQKLFQLIRQWGEALATLRSEVPNSDHPLTRRSGSHTDAALDLIQLVVNGKEEGRTGHSDPLRAARRIFPCSPVCWLCKAEKLLKEAGRA